MFVRAAILSLLVTLPTVSSSVTYVVHPDGSGDFPTIQAAVDAAVAGDIVELTPGTFTGDGNRNVDYCGKAITICSQDADPLGCTIDCQGAARGFAFLSAEGPASLLEGVTITHGSLDPGGAIRCWSDACPTIRNCRFIDNSASMIGGAVCCVIRSSPILEDCTFIGNSAIFGGALIAWVDSEPMITRCTFIENEAWFGGAVEAADRASLVLVSCTFRRNVGERGAAVMSEEDAVVTLRECTFCENEADIGGAGVACEVNGTANLERVIIAFSTSGEAVLLDGSSTATLACCDLYGNAGGDWVGSIATQFGVAGNICEDPLFCDPETGNLRLQPGSPCGPFSPPNPECDRIGAWPVGCDPQAIASARWQPALRLAPAEPNPFCCQTHIRYLMPTNRPQGPVHLLIFDQAGRHVRTLREDPPPTPYGNLLWDGTDDSGTRLAAGTYFLQLIAGDEIRTGRVVLVR